MVERSPEKAGVGGSTPSLATISQSQRATYWAMKAAEAGDLQGWLGLGFEYNTGKLGTGPPNWYRMAMREY